MKRKQILILSLVFFIILSGTVIGKESRENGVQEIIATSETETGSSGETESSEEERASHSISKNAEGTETKAATEEEPNFIMKLGTFLLITAVFLFLIQWHHRKKNKE